MVLPARPPVWTENSVRAGSQLVHLRPWYIAVGESLNVSNNDIKQLLSAYCVPDSDLNSSLRMTDLVYTATYPEGGAVTTTNLQRRHLKHRGLEELAQGPTTLGTE